MRSVVVLPLLLLLLLLLAPFACAASVSLYGSSVNLTYTSDGTYLYVTVSHDYAAWIAIGWHAASDRYGDPTQMYNADFVIAQFDKSGALLSVSDYVTDPTSSDGEADPLPDTDPSVAAKNCTNDVLAYAGFQSPQGTTFSFKRLLVTNDRYCDRPITNASQLVVWARGDSPGRNALDYHGGSSSTHGGLQLNLLSEVAPPPPPSAGSDLAPLHGAMMFSAFGILMVFGVFVGRYLKRYWWWFPLHIAVQSTAIVVAVAAFAIALKMVGGAHFSTWHAKIGFTALCLTAVAPVLGVIADRMYDPKRTALPWWPDYTHWMSGRLALGFGWAAIILGILLVGLPKSVAVAAGLLFALYVVLYFSTDFMKRIGGNDYTPAGSDPINTPVGHD